MKLYYSPGACSQSPHIALCESGLLFDLEKVDLKTHRTETGADYLPINPNGYVPALLLDTGEVLTEGAAIVQYIADLVPETRLAPRNGTIARYELQSWLNFISTELHVPLGLVRRGLGGKPAEELRAKIDRRLHFVAAHLEDRAYLMGEWFSVADGYLFVMTSWLARNNVEIDRALYPNLDAHYQRVRERPAVRAALAREGLLDEARAA